MLTQQTLKEYLHYEPNTGIFTWIKDPYRNPNIVGNIAGTLGTKGYIVIGISGKIYRSHRLVWLYVYGHFPINQIDHVDHVKSNNSLLNLREVTNTVNQQNTRKRQDNKSGVTGIRWESNQWRVQIGLSGKNKHIGMFAKLEDAIAARKQAEIDYGFHPNHGNST
jgi:hypothetical protein